MAIRCIFHLKKIVDILFLLSYVGQITYSISLKKISKKGGEFR